MASTFKQKWYFSLMIFTLLMIFLYGILLRSTTNIVTQIRYIHDNYTSDNILMRAPLNLSFLNAAYYKSTVFNQPKENKFTDPFSNFLSIGNPKQKFTPNYIYFDHEFNNPKLIYCAGINKAGIGNHLAQYWTARAVSFWLAYNFMMMDSFKDKRCRDDAASEMYHKYFINSTWTYYLPKNMNNSVYDYFTADNIARNRIFLWITQTLSSLVKKDGRIKYCYKSRIRLFWYNALFINILIRDTHIALDQFFSNNESMNNVLGDNDVVVHFRCGDILSVFKLEYGFMTLEYYKQAFSNWSYTQNTSIHFVTQLGNNSMRNDVDVGSGNRERKNQNACNYIVNEYVSELQKIVTPATIVINGNNAIDYDFYLMVHAPLLICSESTFCEQAAIANMNNVIMPIHGPWIDLKTMIDGHVWTPSNHRFINNSLTQLTLSSSAVNKQTMSPPQIVQYLITH